MPFAWKIGNGRVFEENSRPLPSFAHMLMHASLDAPIWNEPYYGYRKIEQTRDPLIDKSKRDRDEVYKDRYLTFKIIPNSVFQFGVLVFMVSDDGRLKDGV